MNKEALRIVYMGSPEFAVESLRALVEKDYNVVAVVTMPDKPMGRHGSVLGMSDVKKYALEQGLKILQPTSLKDEGFVEELRELRADLQIVVAFRMLPEIVWAMPRLGTFNIHASLLPQYRGAAPINWAVINGEKKTGLTSFFLQHEIDTGAIIKQVAIDIEDDDNVGDVHDRLMKLSAQLTLDTIELIMSDQAKPIKQDELVSGALKPAPKIFRDTCKIDWTKSANDVYNFIRGLSPYPAAWTMLGDTMLKDKTLKIYQAQKTNIPSCEPIKTDNKSFLYLAANDYYLSIKLLQIEGKKRMSIEDFLRGNRL